MPSTDHLLDQPTVRQTRKCADQRVANSLTSTRSKESTTRTVTTSASRSIIHRTILTNILCAPKITTMRTITNLMNQPAFHMMTTIYQITPIKSLPLTQKIEFPSCKRIIRTAQILTNLQNIHMATTVSPTKRAGSLSTVRHRLQWLPAQHQFDVGRLSRKSSCFVETWFWIVPCLPNY